MFYKGVVFFALLSPYFLCAQLDNYKRITKKLCSSEFHGRGYVNKGDSVAAIFIAEEFERIGISAIKKKGYKQSFYLDVNTFPGKMTVKLGEKVLTPGIHFSINEQSGSYSSKLNPKTLSVDTLLDEKLLIASILKIQENKEGYNSILFNSSHVGSDTVHKIHYILNQISDIIPVVYVTNKKLMWSVGRQQLKFPMIEIQDSVYVKNTSFEVEIESTFIPNYQSQNVIAFLKSKKRRAQTIVVTAHYDHLGRMGSDTYFAGANDNASGTAIMLELARYFKNNPIDKNILFIAFGGEEAGLVGSNYFVNHPLYPLKKIDFLLNIDIMGSGDEGITVVNGVEQEKAFNLLSEINKEHELLKLIKKRGQTSNSDHYWFSTKNVPAIFVYTQGANKNYHDINDTYDHLKFDEVDDLLKLFSDFIINY